MRTRALVLALSSVAFTGLAALAAPAGGPGFEVLSYLDHPERCALPATFAQDPTVRGVMDASQLSYPPDRESVPRLMEWLREWSQRALELSDLPEGKQQVCVALYRDAFANAKVYEGYRLFYGFKRYRDFSERRHGGEPGWSAQALLAHELGHVLQAGHGLTFFKTRTREFRELHADCVAGFLMETSLRMRYPDPAQYRVPLKREFYEMGDLALWAVEHHGTPDEREAAFNRGLELGELALLGGKLPLPSRALLDACSATYRPD